jgi:hypothetical protein
MGTDPHRASETGYVDDAEAQLINVDFSPKIDTGLVVTGTPTAVIEEGTVDGITISNVTGSAQTVQFLIEAGGVPGVYIIIVTCADNGSTPQTHVTKVKVVVT